MQILIDNVLARGFYAYLTGITSDFARDCFWQFLESIVIYDEILITDIESELNKYFEDTVGGIITFTDHEEELGLPNDWWLFRSSDEIPHLLQNASHPKKLATLVKRIEYKPVELLQVERLGFPKTKALELHEIDNILLGEKSGWTYSADIQTFEAYHLCYTFYLMQVALRREIPYVPNPSRRHFLDQAIDIDFFYPAFRRKLIAEFGEIRGEYLNELSPYLRISKAQMELPLIASFIQSKTKQPGDSVKYALELRNSKGAIAFRRYCDRFEKSKDIEHLIRVKREINNFKDYLRKDLSLESIKRVININKYGIESIEPPTEIEKYKTRLKFKPSIWDKIGITPVGDHFIFIHDLVRHKLET